MAQISGLTPVSNINDNDLLMVNQGFIQGSASGVEKRVSIEQLDLFFNNKVELTITIKAGTTIIFGNVTDTTPKHPESVNFEAPVFISIDILNTDINISDCICFEPIYPSVQYKISNHYNIEKEDSYVLYGKVNQYMNQPYVPAIKFNSDSYSSLIGKTAKITAWSKKEFSLNECIVTTSSPTVSDNVWTENSTATLQSDWSEKNSSSVGFIKNKPLVMEYMNAYFGVGSTPALTYPPITYIIGKISFKTIAQIGSGVTLKIDLLTSPYFSNSKSNRLVSANICLNLRYDSESDVDDWRGDFNLNTIVPSSPHNSIKGASFGIAKRILNNDVYLYITFPNADSNYITSIHGIAGRVSPNLNLEVVGNSLDYVWNYLPSVAVGSYTVIEEKILVPNT